MSTALLEVVHAQGEVREQKAAIIIIENQQTWTNHIRSLLGRLCHGEADIFVASNASEGVSLVRALRSNGREPALITLDLHMGDTGENGDDFLRMMAPEGLPRTLILSGTISKEIRDQIMETCGLPCGEKGAALPSNSTDLSGDVLCERVQQAMRSAPPLLSPCQLDRLSGLVHQWNDLPAIDILIDEIKACSEDVGIRYKKWLKQKGQEFRSLFVNPNLYKGNRAGNVHEYKNTLSALVATLEAGDLRAPMGLLDELQRFLQSINAQYKQARDKKEAQSKVDIVDTMLQLCHKLDMLHADGERIDFLSELDEHILSVDPVVFTELMTNALMNALMHGKGTISVQISEEGVISITNEVNPDFELSFTVSENTVEGHIPAESTHVYGSATGVAAMLETVGKIPNGRMNLSQLFGRKGGEVQFGFFIESPSLDKGRSAKVLESREIGKQPEVIFLCHEGEPGRSFSELIDHDSSHQHILVPSDYIFKRDAPDTAPRIRQFVGFVRDHDAIFSRATLCVMHAPAAAFKSVVGRLQLRYPQLIFLPASDYPDAAFHYHYREAKWDPSVEPPECVISPDHVRQYISPEDPATLEGVLYLLYQKDYSEEVWQTLQNIAVRMSDDRLKNMKAE